MAAREGVTDAIAACDCNGRVTRLRWGCCVTYGVAKCGEPWRLDLTLALDPTGKPTNNCLLSQSSLLCSFSTSVGQQQIYRSKTAKRVALAGRNPRLSLGRNVNAYEYGRDHGHGQPAAGIGTGEQDAGPIGDGGSCRQHHRDADGCEEPSG